MNKPPVTSEGSEGPASLRGGGETLAVNGPNLLLLRCFLNRRGRGLRGHFSGRNGDGYVINDAADRRAQVLVEIVLVVRRLGEIVSQALEQRIGERGLGALDDRYIGRVRRRLLGIFRLAKELEEIDRLRGRGPSRPIVQ